MGEVMYVHERIKKLRIELGLSQETFGKKIMITSKAHISLIERGKRKITDRMISDIVREFHVNEKWLRTGEGEKFTDETELLEVVSTRLEGLDELDQKFIVEYLKLKPEHRELFKVFLKKLTKE